MNLLAQQRIVLLYILCGCVKLSFSGFTTTKMSPLPIWNATHTDKLRQDLLLNYDKFSRPAQHYNATTVKFDLTITHLELNEFKFTLTVYAWLHLIWTDEKLKWNSADYGGLSVLRMADHEIWQPDIFVYNSAASAAVSHYGNSHCLTYADGTVLWVPPTQFSVLCNLNLKYWPFDQQECFLKFGSWTYSGEEINLQINDNKTEPDQKLLIESTEWELVSTSMERNDRYYSCCTEAYPDIVVNVTIARRSPSYKAIIVTPAFAIIVLALLTFWLPPQAGEKIVLNGCASVIICLFLLYFTQKIPAMGSHTPLIVSFYSNALYMLSFSMVGSVVVLWLSRTRHTTSLPWIIKRPLTGTMGKWLGLNVFIQQSTMSTHRVTVEEMRDHPVPDFDENNSGEDHDIIKSPIKSSVQQDWVLVAAAIDRISFCFYSLLFTILAITYSL